MVYLALPSTVSYCSQWLVFVELEPRREALTQTWIFFYILEMKETFNDGKEKKRIDSVWYCFE